MDVIEKNWLLAVLCLAAGYAFGNFLAAEIVARCLAGTGVRSIGNGTPSPANLARSLGKPAGLAVVAGDILKTILVCWFCYRLAAPELEERAVLYGGLGALAGHVWPVWLRGRGGAATPVLCTWLTLYLPITGALCCLAGAVVVAGSGNPTWGVVLIPLLAAPVAWLQFGWESGILVLAAGLLLVWQRRRSFSHRKRPNNS